MVRMKNRSWMVLRDTKAGAPKASTSRTITRRPKPIEARVRVSMRMGRAADVTFMMSVRRAREQAARPEQQDGEEGEVSSEDLPFRIDLRAHRLRHADDDAAGEGPPK